MTSKNTLPVNASHDVPESAVVVEASVVDPRTGAHYVHKDLVELLKPWKVEAHAGPPQANERFGDVESWTDYVKRFSGALPDFAPFLSWNSTGLRAVIDYHTGGNEAGRCQWQAHMPFVLSPEWIAWISLANSKAV